MQNRILPLSKKFISIRSISGHTKELDTILRLALSPLKNYTVERFKKNGVKSALVYRGKKRPKKFRVILNGHLDVIPGKQYQFAPLIKGKRLYGAGSMDMKANAACLIMAFGDVVDKINYDLGLQLVTDEETGGFDGTQYQVEKGVRADFVIAGEPTNFDIVHKAKGVLIAKISANGKTAHGAYPWRGSNAIWSMLGFLQALKKRYPIPNQERWVTTVNLCKIETSNQTFNKIPDDCAIILDIRYILEESNSIVAGLRKLLPKGFVIDIVAKEPALMTSSNNNFIQLLKKTTRQITRKKIALRGAQGTSDARHFAQAHGAGIEFGPIGGGIGSDSEWVDIPSLNTYYQILTKFLLSIRG